MKYNPYKSIFSLSENEDGSLRGEDNRIEYDNQTWELEYLSTDFKGSKGGNSSVFRLKSLIGVGRDLAIKICKYPQPNRNSKPEHKRRYGRFINEIDALKKIKETGPVVSNVVEFLDDGVISIDDLVFSYYIMEKADSDLKEYLFKNRENIDSQERIRLCFEIYNGIKTLHINDYYHRDIKPDNILLFFEDGDETQKFTWKVGDLGLVAERNKEIDEIGEKLGPVGWLSPEAMNKFLTEKYELGLDCYVNNASDIFQLGKLFWFVFQYNVPIGQITINDFQLEIANKKFLFDTIFLMLQYSKAGRDRELEEIDTRIKFLNSAFGN